MQVLRSMSKVILTFVFFVVLTPIGLLRRLMGADSMQLKKWKKDAKSVLKKREQKFVMKDIENPY